MFRKALKQKVKFVVPREQVLLSFTGLLSKHENKAIDKIPLWVNSVKCKYSEATYSL